MISHVTKSFRKSTSSGASSKKAYSTLKSSILVAAGKVNSERPVTHALKEISILVPAGKAIGLIGRNGSGKSTLLKLIAGIYTPDSGTVEVSGRISALIELGAGFHPDFTGRENVHLGGIMFGMTRKEIDQKFDQIVAFAELEDFIDDPVRTYSSGMYMRLGFSLAIHTDPDILLVDEVLAVGDVAFIHRCHDRISDLKRRGKTLIFVTHDLDSVKRWCDEAIWLNKGVVEARGEPQVVIDRYLSSVEQSEEESIAKEKDLAGNKEITKIKSPAENPVEKQLQPLDQTRWGSGEVEISSVTLLRDGQEHWLVHSGENLELRFDYQLKNPVSDLVFGLGILRADGLTVFGTNTEIEGLDINLLTSSKGQGQIKIKLEKLSLLEGSYFIDVAAHKSDGTPYDYHHLLYKLSVRNPKRYHGVYTPSHEWILG